MTQDTAGVGGSAEPGDLFGDHLAYAAPGLGDTATRLAVSIPTEDGAAANQGQVPVFPMSNLGAETSYARAYRAAWARVTSSAPPWRSCPGRRSEH